MKNAKTVCTQIVPTTGLSVPGGTGALAPPPPPPLAILSDQLTLSQPGGRKHIIFTTLLRAPTGYLDLPTALYYVVQFAFLPHY